MKLSKLALATFLSLSLSACFHIQLKGSVGGANLTIAELRNPENVLGTAVSWTPGDLVALWGQGTWDDLNSFLRLIVTGIAQLTPNGLDPDALYLVTASGGMDYDPEADQNLSSKPVVVQGSWHAIASGQRILDGNIKVSALTEALFRQLQARLSQWNDSQVKARLNAAAELVVGDVDDSGSVDYDDVMSWNRTVDGAFYPGDLADIDGLSEAIISGQPDSMVTDRAREVLGNHTVVMEFDSGTVTLETLNWDSPITAANFLSYVRAGFYNQMLVHRAIDGFMIQMGLVEFLGVDESGLIQWGVKPPNAPIVNESSNGLPNVRGTLSMARTSDPDSANAQFFINQVNNNFLDHGSSTNPDGYAVFARVLAGMAVVDAIAAEPTVAVGGIGNEVPARGVLLRSVSLEN